MDGPTWTANFEGNRLVSYQDTRGFWTIGKGHCLGRGDEFKGIVWPQSQVDQQYAQDYSGATGGARTDLGDVAWALVDPIRQCAIIDMSFELGEVGLDNFHKMISAILIGDWTSASADVIASRYDWQVPNRAGANSQLILTGNWPS